VSGLTQGTGVTVTHTPSEGSSPTIAIGQDVSTSASVTFLKVETTGDVVVGGNLTVNGTTTTLNTETLAVEDNIVVLNSNVTSSPSTNAGIEVERGTSANVLIRWNETNDQWEFTNDGTTYGDIAALGAIELGTDTTGNFVSDITQGTGVTVTHTPGEGSSPTVAIGQAVGTSASVTFAHVSAPVTGNVTGNVTGSSGSTTGNAATATALQNARTISLSGDVSGSVSFDGTSNVSISATVEPNSVALGTDTTGNYVNDLTAGTGITVTHTPGEGSSPTVAIGQSVATSASVTFAKLDTTGDITVGGNLTVNGTTTTLNTETLAIEDNIVVLNSGVTGSPTVNAGIEVERGTSANVDLRWNESTDKWEFTNDGSTYSNLGAGGATISDTPPSSPVTGQIWYESDTGKTFVYYDSFWIEIVGSTGAQGPTGATGATGAAGSSDLDSGLESGTYYTAASTSNTIQALTLTLNSVSYLPFLVEQTQTFDRIACRTGSTVTGSGTMRLGIYNNSNKKPSTVVLDAGTVAFSATTTVYAITINQTLTPGWYWLAAVMQSSGGSTSFTTIGDVVPFNVISLTTTFNGLQPTWQQTGVTGAFATAASLTSTTSSRTLVALRAV
jgi:hypothetical protein